MNSRSRARKIGSGAGLVAASATLLFSTAAGATEHARFELRQDAPNAGCPDERQVRDAVAARLGYEPFVEDSGRLLRVRFYRSESLLRASVEASGGTGSVQGKRDLSSSTGDCAELSSAVTLTVSILLDPRSSSRSRVKRPIAPPAAIDLPDRGKMGAAQTTPPAPTDSFHGRFGLRATLSTGVLPTSALGMEAALGAEFGFWALEASLRVDNATTRQVDAFDVSSAYVAGGAAACARLRPAYGCGFIYLGTLRFDVPAAQESRQSSFHALVGPRAGLSLPLLRWLAIDGHVDGAYAVTQTTIQMSGRALWSTPTISGLVGIGVVALFP